MSMCIAWGEFVFPTIAVLLLSSLDCMNFSAHGTNRASNTLEMLRSLRQEMCLDEYRG